MSPLKVVGLNVLFIVWPFGFILILCRSRESCQLQGKVSKYLKLSAMIVFDLFY